MHFNLGVYFRVWVVIYGTRMMYWGNSERHQMQKVWVHRTFPLQMTHMYSNFCYIKQRKHK